MREKGEYIRKGSLEADGDFEFYDEKELKVVEKDKPA
jgi:hypothetical protein